MRRAGPGYLPAAVAVAATLLACALSVAGAKLGARSGEAAPLVALLLVPIPLVVSVLWGGAVIMTRPHRLALAGAVLWLAAAWPLFPGAVTWPLAAHVAAGVVAGLALGARWRLDAALGLIALALVPLTAWSVAEMPVGEQLDLMREEMRPLLAESLPQGGSPDARARALAREEENFERVLDLGGRIYPFLLGCGLLGEGLVILVLVWLLVRGFGWRLPSWRPPPFGRWRLPFYLVWVLAAGIAMMVTRQPLLAHAGLNVALLAAALLGVQGIAVQFHATARVMSPLGRVLFWTLTGVFLPPVVIALGVALGLADQWLDLRGLDRPAQDTEGSGG